MKKRLLVACGIVLLLALFLEAAVRVIVDLPAKTDFHSSIKREEIPGLQERFGVKVNAGPGWLHLGWVADPERQVYRVTELRGGVEVPLGETGFGSFLVHDGAAGHRRFRVTSQEGLFDRTVDAVMDAGSPGPVLAPRIITPWRPLFRPTKAGNYINDHALYRAADGTWHLAGITAFGEGDYSKEVRLAHGVSPAFPPPPGETMKELAPIADFGHLAWAPTVEKGDRYYMWYSPHRAYCASSTDGYEWKEEKGREFLPYHPQFRDPMVFRVAEGQWLMYATARDGYYSTVDLYQSFDLEHWQYIGPALETGFGAERAAPQASTESPFVLFHEGRYYLSVTYNNDSFFWNAILLTLKVWLDRDSYNETLVFHSGNPYSFGLYRGRGRPSSLAAIISAHGAEYVKAGNKWYITTAGWPWMASLTKGEAAVAELVWEKKQ